MEKMKKDEFDQIFDLMKLSFPIIEYRDYDAQKALLSDPHYHCIFRIFSVRFFSLSIRFLTACGESPVSS